ncbi:MAG: GEVED domain-containing protein [Pyrinomonadaceae bacterium]
MSATYTSSSNVLNTIGNDSVWVRAYPTGRVSPALSTMPPMATSSNPAKPYAWSNTIGKGESATTIITFSHQVHDPEIHLTLIGPTSITVSGSNPTTSYPSPTLTKLSGNNNLVASGNIIDGTTSGGGGDCGTTTLATQGCGSFRISGDYTTLVLYHHNSSLITADGYSFAITTRNEFGDAPATYGNSVHIIDSPIVYYLGTGTPDAEAESKFSVNADGDDLDNIDDENGVTVSTFKVGYIASIPVQTVGSGGYLSAWIDFNGNGVFDAGENFANNVQDGGTGDNAPAAGTILLNVSVPMTSITGSTYARFRWSPNMITSPIGTVIQGEVEDYKVQIIAAPIVGLSKSCTIPSTCTTAAQMPGTDLTYKIDFVNSGTSNATSLALMDAIPVNTDFKLGSATVDTGSTGLNFVSQFSSDYNPAAPASATWAYTPVSGGGGASAGYDRNVKAVRWMATSGTLSYVSPNNAGYVSFVTKIR